jgi:hypothetical protein
MGFFLPSSAYKLERQSNHIWATSDRRAITLFLYAVDNPADGARSGGLEVVIDP